MLDRYISGATDRLSPEAPVPVVKIESEYAMLGGAANVASNLAKLGADVSLYGVVGNDDSGKQVIALLEEKNIANQLLEADIHTTVKTRVISRNQQMMRVDREDIFSDESELINNLMAVLSFFQGSAVIISDYAKGVCTSDATKSIINWAKKNNVKVFIDPKGADWSKYEGAYLIKPNVKEIEELFNMSVENTNDEIASYGSEVRSRFNIDNVLITRSEKGMSFIGEDTQHISGKKIDIYDLSGAGDTVIAVLVYLIQEGMDLLEAIKKANNAGTYVVTKPNTYAISLDELNALN